MNRRCIIKSNEAPLADTIIINFFRDLHFTINHKDSEIDRLNYDISIVNEKLREETRLRKR